MISLIIAFYKNTAALDLILKALETQTYTDFEIIIAEDDNSVQTLDFIKQAIANSPLRIKHVHQERDAGFRKNQILNKAITQAEGEILVFIDGDCIPHRNFIQAYASSITNNTALFGRRVMLSERLTERLYRTKRLSLISLWHLLTSRSKKIKYSFYLPFLKPKPQTGIWGCNWGVCKKDLIEINGFDEDFQTAGAGEDVDIAWRLRASGITIKSIRFSAIVYHLHHPLNYNCDDVNVGFRQIKEKKALNNIRCINGLEKLQL